MRPLQWVEKVSAITAVLAASSCAYYLLLTDNLFNCSIASIVLFIRELDIAPHAFVIGLLPIYIAITIFGTVWMGVLVRRLVYRAITYLVQLHHPEQTKI